MARRASTKRFARVLFVDQEGRLLVVRQNNAGSETYCYPGGKVEEGEKPQKAAAREVFEELGIRKRPNSLRPLVRKKFSFAGVSWVGSFYLCVASGLIPTLLEEPKVSEARFVSLSDLGNLDGDRETLVDVALNHSDAIESLIKQMRVGTVDGRIL